MEKTDVYCSEIRIGGCGFYIIIHIIIIIQEYSNYFRAMYLTKPEKNKATLSTSELNKQTENCAVFGC